MNSKDYLAGVLSTESVPSSLQINQIGLHSALILMISAAEIGNLVKRKLYYGKPIPDAAFQSHLDSVGSMAAFLQQVQEYDPAVINSRMTPEGENEIKTLDGPAAGMDLDKVDIRLLHASLGMYTETGEMLKAMLGQYETGVLDKVNFGEEIGDVDWYKMVAHDATGVSEEDARTLNNRKLLDKLAGRFKSGGFTADEAVNRNTAAERTILDGTDQAAAPAA